MLSSVKPTSEKFAKHVAKHLRFVSPNVLTLIGSIPPLLFFVFVVLHWYGWALVVYFGNLFDMLDGAVARLHGKESAFGGFLDSTFDRISDFLIISAFGFAGLVSWNLVVPFLCVSFLISYVRSRGELASGNRVKFAVGIMERTERLIGIFLALGLFVFFPNFYLYGFSVVEIVLLVLLLLSVVTLIQRILFAYKKL